MNVIKDKKQYGRQWNRLIDAMVAIIQYKKTTIYNDILI